MSDSKDMPWNDRSELEDRYDIACKQIIVLRQQCEMLSEYLKDVIRNSTDIIAKKHCSQGLKIYQEFKDGS